jgi:RimJ/RimL family protein N-acetyltransferase
VEVRIRPYQEKDAHAFYAAARESTGEVYPWLPWCHPDFSLEEAKAWIEYQMRLFEQRTEFEFVMVDDEDRLLGGCGLNQINSVHRIANLGYWVRTSATGQGIATAAVGQLAAFAFSETSLGRLEIVCAVGNEASQRVAEKAGAIREGVLRGRLFLHEKPHDAVMYAMLRSEWNAE